VFVVRYIEKTPTKKSRVVTGTLVEMKRKVKKDEKQKKHQKEKEPRGHDEKRRKKKRKTIPEKKGTGWK